MKKKLFVLVVVSHFLAVDLWADCPRDNEDCGPEQRTGLFANTGIKKGEIKISGQDSDIKRKIKFQVDQSFSERIKALVEFQLDNDSIDLEEDITKAMIILQVHDSGISATIGKHNMPFGLKRTHSQRKEHGLGFRHMLGTTITFQGEVLGRMEELISSLEVSIFEEGRKDFKISDEKGLSVRFIRIENDQLTWTASASLVENPDTSEFDNERLYFSSGVVYTSEDKATRAWLEGLYIDNDSRFAPREKALLLGLSQRINDNWRVTGRYTNFLETEDEDRLEVFLTHDLTENWKFQGGFYVEEEDWDRPTYQVRLKYRR